MDNQKKAPPEVRAVVDFLRNKGELKVRPGLLAEKRAEYFKGKSAVKALLSPAYAKLQAKKPTLPKLETDEQAAALLHSLIPFTFFLLVNRGGSVQAAGGKIKLLQINPQQQFTPDEYYVWLVDPNPLKLYLGAFAMVACLLAAVMFPLWPAKLRIGVWYLSIGVLGLVGAFFGIAIIRLVVFVITWVALSPGIWIFPNLFEDVGFVDSFIPFWGWNIPPPKKARKSKKSGKGGLAVPDQGGDSATSGANSPARPGSAAGGGRPKIEEISD